MFEKKMTQERNQAKEQKGEKGLSIVKTLLIPALLAAVTVCALYAALQQKNTREDLKTTVLCLKQDVAAHTYVDAGDTDAHFTSVKVEKAAVPENAVKSLSELPEGGFYVENDMKASQMLLAEDVSDEDAAMAKYKNGYEVTSFNAAEFADGVNGALRKGDVVDVYALDPATKELGLMAEDVYVAEVYDNSGKKITEPDEIATSFTVYVTGEEVEKINEAVCNGGIQLYQKAV